MSNTASTARSKLPINIVGAGLAGSMAALVLAQCGEQIRLIEARPDFRITDNDSTDAISGYLSNSLKRSLNLALSYRGMCALRSAGLLDKLQSIIIPMTGRYMHPIGATNSNDYVYQPYGKGDEAIYSVTRTGINKVILDELDSLENVELIFNEKVLQIDEDATLTTNRASYIGKWVIGADGAYSQVRNALRRFTRMNFSMQYISHGYKELSIPPTAANQFAIEPHSGLHIWPRGDFMLIALPNPDNSFTCTLFAPFTGNDGLDSLARANDNELLNYFQRYFPDIIPLIGKSELISQFRTSPNSALLTVKCDPYHYSNKLLLIGDAAHAVVPFYAQGMNAAFEDCLILKELYLKHNGNSAHLIPAFTSVRSQAGIALADLSMDNYLEMRSHTRSKLFLMKKRIEGVIHDLLPHYWIPKYSMVAFSRMPYHIAAERASKQEKVLNYTLIFVGILSLLTALIAAYNKVQQYIYDFNSTNNVTNSS